MQQLLITGDAHALDAAATALAGRRIKAGVRAFAMPADNEQYVAAIDSGAIKALHAAGVVICAPGTPPPALAPGEAQIDITSEGLAKLLQ